MGRNVLIILVAAASVQVLQAGEAGGQAPGRPKIVFEQTTHDFGQVGPSTRNSCEFHFTNAGEGVLLITEVTKTCGCTPVTLDKKRYEPGESGVIKVKYHASSKPGNANKHLYVKSNDTENPNVTLFIKAEIVQKVEYHPANLVLSPGEENGGMKKITLRSIDGQSFKISRFKATGNCIWADLSDNKEAPEFMLEPKVNTKELKKHHKGRIEISLTHPECASVKIPFRVLARFEVNPQSINLPRVKESVSVTRSVHVSSNYGESFEIASASSEKGLVKLLDKQRAGKGYMLKIQITPPPREGRSRFESDKFTVKTADGDEIALRCSMFYADTSKEKPASAGEEK